MHRPKVADMLRAVLTVWWIALLWLANCGTVRSTENCLYSRLNFLPCQPNAYTTAPGANEYAEYRTRIRYNYPDCIYRNRNYYPGWEIIRPIDTLGNPNIRLLYSPGFTYNETYKDQVLVSYNVECPAGRLPFLAFSNLDLQGEDCYNLCEDYVTVTCTGCGSSESCGVVPTDDLYSLEEESFTVTLRTSESARYNGFELIVICFDPTETDDADTSVRRRKRHFNRLLKGWRKRAAAAPINAALGDYEATKFTLAPPQPLRFVKLNITFGDIVTYTENVIIVKRGGEVISKIGEVEKLTMHDTNGDDYTFFREAAILNEFRELTFLRLRGPGEIVIFSNEARFFRYYQPPVTLTPIEQKVLMSLATELFDLVPRENSSDGSYGDEPDDLDYYLDYTTKSDLDETDSAAVENHPPPHHDYPHPPSKPRRSVSTSAIQLSIFTETSSNPVIRAVATSTLSIAEEQDPTRVDEERRYIEGKKKNPTESTAPPTTDRDPELTRPTERAFTRPTERALTRPTDPALTRPTNPAFTRPTDPALTRPTDPALTRPTERVFTRPAERG